MLPYNNQNENYDQDGVSPQARLAEMNRNPYSREWRIPNGPQRIKPINNRVYKFFIDEHQVSVSKMDEKDGMDVLMVQVDGASLQVSRYDFNFLYSSDGFFEVNQEGIFTTQDDVTFENGNIYFNGNLIRRPTNQVTNAYGKPTGDCRTYAADRLSGKIGKPTNPKEWYPIITSDITKEYCQVGEAINILAPLMNRTVELLRTEAKGFNVIIDDKLATVNGKPIMITSGEGDVIFGKDKDGDIAISGMTGDILKINENATRITLNDVAVTCKNMNNTLSATR
ncbi:MAG: hypothetical protein LBM38_00985 [Clostridiales bacterium]|jgi:hypothetical protein|nr:hypothetical protein [Clostridiales bacterium]